MSNFTLSEPPVETGSIENDFKELLLWCKELHNNLWLIDFMSIQQRKNEKGIKKSGG